MKVKGKKCWRNASARYPKPSRNLRSSTIPMHTAAATRTTAPPAFRSTSCISSVGGSQKSIVSATGPDKYHPSHKRTRNLIARRFITLSVPALARFSPGATFQVTVIMHPRLGSTFNFFGGERREGREERPGLTGFAPARSSSSSTRQVLSIFARKCFTSRLHFRKGLLSLVLQLGYAVIF